MWRDRSFTAKPGDPIPTLATDRLVLRPWREEDRAPFAAMSADPEVMRHFPAPLTRAESGALIERFREKAAADGYAFQPVTRRDGAFLGIAGLARPSFEAPFTPCTEIGWRLARHAWGQGYATEAARAVLAWGFDTIGLEQIVSFTPTGNAASERVMQRLGMTASGTFDHPALPGGHPLRRHLLYRLDRQSWEAAR